MADRYRSRRRRLLWVSVLDRSVWIERETDQQRHRIGRDQLVGLIRVGEVQAARHGAILPRHAERDQCLNKTSRLDPERYFELGGERVLVFAVLRGRGGQSGVDVTMTGAHVTRWRDGLLVYAKGYARREDALRDLGVSLDDLEPIDP